MHLELTDDLTEYRDRLRAHVAAHRPAMQRLPGTRSPKRDDLPQYRAWCASLFEAGFVGADWPTEWGGREDHNVLQDFVFDTELADAKVPRPIGAYNLISGALLEYGTQAQKEHFLPRIRGFEDLWCQLFSEPDAGSDLASLRTKAERDGDEWVVTGQKVWTTHAHVADYGFLLARTDPSVAKHAGISAFIVDMRSPGVTVRPLREMTGSSDFNEVFFDAVRIPTGNMIGAPGEGWRIAMSTASHERGLSLRSPGRFSAAATRLVELWQRAGDPDDTALRDRVVDAWIGAQAYRLHTRRTAARLAAGGTLGAESSLGKVFWSELDLALHETALDLLGPEAELREDQGGWADGYLFALAGPIYAGTNEIQRNIVAERLLGLPRA